MPRPTGCRARSSRRWLKREAELKAAIAAAETRWLEAEQALEQAQA